MANVSNDSFFGRDKLYHLIGSMALVVAVYLVYSVVAASGEYLRLALYIITLIICLLKEKLFDEFMSIKDMVVNAIGASVIFFI